MLSFKKVLVLLFVLAMIAVSNNAYAQRDAGSKIRGDYSFYGPSRASYSSMRYATPTTARRSFSYDSRASQGKRAYSYQPQAGCTCQ